MSFDRENQADFIFNPWICHEHIDNKGEILTSEKLIELCTDDNSQYFEF